MTELKLWKVLEGPFGPEDNPCGCEECSSTYWITVMTTQGDLPPVDLEIVLGSFDDAYTLKKEIERSMEPLIMEVSLDG